MSSIDQTAFDPAHLDLLMEDFLDAIPAGPDGGERRRLAARAMVLAMKPADACEAMLAMHAVAAHYAAIDAWKRAAQPELDGKTAMRMQASAAGAARMMQAALRTLQARRKAEAQTADGPTAARRTSRTITGPGAGPRAAPGRAGPSRPAVSRLDGETGAHRAGAAGGEAVESGSGGHDDRGAPGRPRHGGIGRAVSGLSPFRIDGTTVGDARAKPAHEKTQGIEGIRHRRGLTPRRPRAQPALRSSHPP